MFTPSKSALDVLKKFNATYRTHVMDKKHYAQAIDNTTGQLYVIDGNGTPLEVEGHDAADAVENLCKIIPTAEKPMTKAQAASILAAREEMSEKDREIADLKAKLAAATGSAPPPDDDEPAPKRGRGRPRKAVVEVEEPASI